MGSAPDGGSYWRTKYGIDGPWLTRSEAGRRPMRCTANKNSLLYIYYLMSLPIKEQHLQISTLTSKMIEAHRIGDVEKRVWNTVMFCANHSTPFTRYLISKSFSNGCLRRILLVGINQNKCEWVSLVLRKMNEPSDRFRTFAVITESMRHSLK